MSLRRIYMKFEKLLGTWRVSFVVLGGNEKLRDYAFSDEGKITRMAERAGALRDLATKQGLENGIRNGLGGIELNLSEEQFARLRR